MRDLSQVYEALKTKKISNQILKMSKKFEEIIHQRRYADFKRHMKRCSVFQVTEEVKITLLLDYQKSNTDQVIASM